MPPNEGNSFSFSLTKFVRKKNIFPPLRTTQEKQRQKTIKENTGI